MSQHRALVAFLLLLGLFTRTCALVLPSSSECVATGLELVAAVDHAPATLTGVGVAYLINICNPRLFIVDHTKKGIDFTNKNIYLNCTLSDISKKCVIDGKKATRLFRGASARLTVERIRFSNGAASEGGAMYFTSNSVITLNKGTMFSNNVATTGGAIYIASNSKLVIRGAGTVVGSAVGVSFQDNTAIKGAAIFLGNSRIQSSNLVWYTNNQGEVSRNLSNTIKDYHMLINLYIVFLRLLYMRKLSQVLR